jgi:hypothetical protein
MVIYARVDEVDSQFVKLHVARLSARPALVSQQSASRLPRPDDPTPRKPMALFGAGKRELKKTPSGTNDAFSRDLKRVASSSNLVPAAKRRKPTDPRAADLGSSLRLDGKIGEGLFKVPEVPINKGKGKARQLEVSDDVFGSSSAESRPSELLEISQSLNGEVEDVERSNKNVGALVVWCYLMFTFPLI